MSLRTEDLIQVKDSLIVTLACEDIQPEAHKFSGFFSEYCFITMPRDTKMKTTKRKTEAPPAPTANKSKKIDSAKEMKKSTETELNSQLRTLQQKNSDLLEENMQHKQKISMLERKLELKDTVPKPEKTSISVQTEDMNRMFCVECEYPAEDLFDLGEHMYEVHAELNDEYSIACHYCGIFFQNQR